MRKFLLSSAALLVAATVLTADLGAMPTCFKLPKHNYADPSWTYSHQCHEGTRIWYVYIDSSGGWHLVSTTIQP